MGSTRSIASLKQALVARPSDLHRRWEHDGVGERPRGGSSLQLGRLLDHDGGVGLALSVAGWARGRGDDERTTYSRRRVTTLSSYWERASHVE